MTSSQPASPTPSRWVAPAALLIAEIAIGVAIWALVRTPGEAAVSAQQSDDAKARVCVAFDMVRKAVSVRTNADLGPDPVAKEAVAANARLATLGGGEYLLLAWTGQPHLNWRMRFARSRTISRTSA